MWRPAISPIFAHVMDALVSAYLRLPLRLRVALPPGLKHWGRARLLPRLQRRGGRTVRLEAKLWEGFSRSAAAELAAMVDAPETSPAAAAAAALALARWYAVADDFDAALEATVAARTRHPGCATQTRQFLLEAKYLCLLERREEARALMLERTRDATFLDASSALMLAATHRGPAASAADAAAALGHINAVFAREGLATLALHDPALPLSIDNLAAARRPRAVAGPRVSVIVPAFRCAATLPTALRSLAAQSWENLEVLVVDDASGDETPEVAVEFAARDPRFRLIRQTQNAGSYACRNRALGEATGALITVHDADDWSHPEKIRLQAEALAKGGTDNFSAWSRTLPDLTFLGTIRASRTLVSLNFSAHMIRRDALIAAGGWDRVRVTGDSELVWRLEALAGRPKDAFRDRLVRPDCPLSFGRLSASSLTGTQATHVLSIHHGLRREYREAADHWHARLRRGEGRAALALLDVERFPAPAAIRPERISPPPLDLVMVADFNMLGGTHHSTMAMLEAGRRAGLTLGLVQYRRYDLDVTRPLNPEVRDLAWAAGMRIIAPGETASARTLVFSHPPLASHVMDRVPAIAHDRLVVVVNQMAERRTDGLSPVYDPGPVRAHLREMFGSEGLWAPISARVRALMVADPRYPPPLEDTWTPLIDAAAWAARPAAWRGETRPRPVIGRHGRDHPLKWPVDRHALRAAYCAGRACEVRFLGGAKHAAARVGRWPRNWRAEPFGARPPRAFLTDLDVFLHYPDPDYIEEFGRAPMEAMAVGVPVILPPEFRPTFGEAALYAEPEGVWPLVERLWRDRGAWEAQAAAGRAFVAAECDLGVFPGRLDRLARAGAEPASA